MDTPLFLHKFYQWLEAEDHIGFILENINGPLAYGEIWVDFDSKDLELAHIVVNPECRGKGFGKRLTNLLFEHAREFGFPTVYIGVYPENKLAIYCYRSAKFEQVDNLSPNMSPEWVWLSRSY